MFSPLANRLYRRLFAAQIVALFGSGLTTVALGLLAWDLAGGDAGLVLGTALALKMVAYVTVAPVAGALAHRVPRRPLLIGLDLARAGVVICLPFVTEVWQIYILIVVLNVCTAGFTPTFQATIPDILPDKAAYTRALSLSRLAYDTEALLSPTLAATALAFVSYDPLFAVNAAAFLVSAALVASVTVPAARQPERTRGVLGNLGFGLHAYLATPRLRGLLALSLAAAGAGSMVIVNTVVYARDLLGRSETDVALLFAASGAGSIAMAMALPRLLDRLAERTVMLAGGAALAVAMGLGLLQPDYLALGALWLLIGGGSAAVQTPAGRLLRRSARDADRPAVFAAQFALSHLCWLVAYPIAGWVGAGHGMTAAFAASAALAVVGTGVAAMLWPRLDPADLPHTHAPIDHNHLHTHDDPHHQHAHEGWEGPEPHRHPHRHAPVRHRHVFVIDLHHRAWPTG